MVGKRAGGPGSEEMDITTADHRAARGGAFNPDFACCDIWRARSVTTSEGLRSDRPFGLSLRAPLIVAASPRLSLLHTVAPDNCNCHFQS